VNQQHSSREILPVTTPDGIRAVAELAREIWTRHFVPIIGRAQVDYMLETIQSAPAIARQVKEGAEYWLLRVDGHGAGYFALVPDVDQKSVMLSKFYVLERLRGHGHGAAMLTFIEHRCRDQGMHELWLTVNRHNEAPIAIYKHMGFEITGTIVKDIGNGFVMDDYRMAKSLTGIAPAGH
jgi:GNAT superfamily N-acetyltransferase